MTPGLRSRRGKALAIFDAPILYTLADSFCPGNKNGRPRAYPNSVLLGMTLLVNAFDSYRDMVQEFEDDATMWESVRAAVVRNAPGVALPDSPPTRRPILYFQNQHLTDHLPGLSEALTATAVELAHSLGLGGACEEGTLTSPSPRRMLTTDGTTVPAFFRSPKDYRVDRATGERVPTRCDKEARKHTSGDDRQHLGHKFSIISARHTGRGQARVILSVDAVDNDEARASLEGVDRIQEHGFGAAGLVYDGALHGAHQVHLVESHGMILVNRVARKNSGDHASKERLIDVKTCKCGDNSEIWSRNGGLHTASLRADAERVLTPLSGRQVKSRKNKDGTHRLYVEYRLSCICGSVSTCRTPLANSSEDGKRSLNRAEHVVPYPRTTPPLRRSTAHYVARSRVSTTQSRSGCETGGPA